MTAEDGDHGIVYDVGEGDLVMVASATGEQMVQVESVGHDHGGLFVSYRLANGSERWDYARDLLSFQQTDVD